MVGGKSVLFLGFCDVLLCTMMREAYMCDLLFSGGFYGEPPLRLRGTMLTN
jgi:hypothetical protein